MNEKKQLTTKQGKPLQQLTTEVFADLLLNNPNKVFYFLKKPDSDFCYCMTSIRFFGVQTVIASAFHFIGEDLMGVPGVSFAFSLFDYDAPLELICDYESCMNDMVNGLNKFNAFCGENSGEWYIMEKKQEHRLEAFLYQKAV